VRELAGVRETSTAMAVGSSVINAAIQRREDRLKHKRIERLHGDRW